MKRDNLQQHFNPNEPLYDILVNGKQINRGEAHKMWLKEKKKRRWSSKKQSPIQTNKKQTAS